MITPLMHRETTPRHMDSRAPGFFSWNSEDFMKSSVQKYNPTPGTHLDSDCKRKYGWVKRNVTSRDIYLPVSCRAISLLIVPFGWCSRKLLPFQLLDGHYYKKKFNSTNGKEIYRTYFNMLGVEFCRRVLTKSKGWNRTVEHVPDTEPAMNALMIGCWKIIKQLLVFKLY